MHSMDSRTARRRTDGNDSLDAASPGAPARSGTAADGQPDRALRSARWRVSASAPGDLCVAARADHVRAGPRHAGTLPLHRGAGRQGRDAGPRSVRIRSRAHARLRRRPAGRRPGRRAPASGIRFSVSSWTWILRASRNSPRGSTRVASRRPPTIAGSMSDTRPTTSSTP